MVKQNVLPFKLDSTNDQVTPNAGLALAGEFMIGLGLRQMFDAELPGPGSAVGYKPSEFVLPILLMLHGGGRSIEDLREVALDEGLRDLVGLEKVPSVDAVGDWLRRMGSGAGLEGAAAVNHKLLARALRDDERRGYTLDIDATGIEAEKKEARMTYKGFKGYMPMVGHLAENGMIVGEEFREGNISPGTRNLEFIQYCISQMPAGKEIKYLRADSAAYQAEIFNFCEDEGIEFAIGADLDAAVLAAIKSLPESAWRDYQNGQIAETVHCMNKSKAAFRLIVLRRPYQQGLFEEARTSLKYTVIASNRGDETAEETLSWYNQRGDASENRLKDLKVGMSMERMPCGQFEANAMWFCLGCIAYNLFVMFKLAALDKSCHRQQVQTVRWRLYHIAGKVVHHGGVLWLKIRRSFEGIFEQIRLRAWEYSYG